PVPRLGPSGGSQAAMELEMQETKMNRLAKVCLPCSSPFSCLTLKERTGARATP
ncbi:unnamed protein product, partial [Rangifer tarandus platyrhynchus]